MRDDEDDDDEEGRHAKRSGGGGCRAFDHDVVRGTGGAVRLILREGGSARTS